MGMLYEDYIDSDEMVALSEIWIDSSNVPHMDNDKLWELRNHDAKNNYMIEDIESIIKNFLLLDAIEQHQVSYLIEMLDVGNEKEKRIILESLGLENITKNE